jgi:hypothetical protein
MLGMVCAFAGNGGGSGPPSPTAKTNDFPVDPPDGLPIDENVIILAVIALCFGIYIIYKHSIKTKAYC